jgi:CheY-like chemotaxis protein
MNIPGTVYAELGFMDCKQTVLVVEDNNNGRELLVMVIKGAGYDVVEASTGLEAVDRAHAFHPDLILMDIGLPGINGDEATKRIKADPSTRNIPVIVNTAFNKDSPAVQRAIAAGAAEILFKPVNFTALRNLVHQYLSRDTKIDYSYQHATI